MKDWTKFIVCAVSGALITIIYKVNSASIKKNQTNLDILKNQKSVPVSNLKQAFELIEGDNQQLFVEGIITQNTELLKSIDNKHKGVYLKRIDYDIELVENNGRIKQERRKKKEEIEVTDSFLLQSQTKNLKKDQELRVYNFGDTKILPKVLKQSKKENIFSSPEVRQIMREPEKYQSQIISDVERAQFKAGQIKQFQTTISKIGIVVEENILCEGTFLCIYGKIVWNSSKKLFTVSAPQYFGASKEQIIEYLEADQYFLKFLNILFTLSGTVCLVLGIKYLYQFLAKYDQNKSLESSKKTE